MPPPSSENDLKRRARRRLIGAVALTLLAVIVLPLLLEDEPPPASSLAVKMAVLPATDVLRDLPNLPKAPAQAEAPVQGAAAPAQAEVTEPKVPRAVPPKPKPEPEPLKHAAPKSAVPRPEPLKHEPTKPEAPKPEAKHATPAARQTKPVVAAASEGFVVQLAALSDADKAHALKARASNAGLPAYTDSVGKLTRVRVGPYETRADAVAAAVKLAEYGMAGQVVAK